jgi:hypothetical protein
LSTGNVSAETPPRCVKWLAKSIHVDGRLSITVVAGEVAVALLPPALRARLVLDVAGLDALASPHPPEALRVTLSA